MNINKSVLIVVAMLVFPVQVNAATCYLPNGCEYIDSEFSTGGGDSPSYVMEVTCKMPEDRIVKYVDWKLNAASLFGFGRISAPESIEFKKGSANYFKCNYDEK